MGQTSVVPTTAELIDLFFRSLWTFIAGALAIPIGVSALNLDVSLLQSMALAGLTGVVGVVSVYSRQKLGTIPPKE